LAGFGNIGAALSGIQQIVGLEGELPIGPFGPYTDYVAPRFALVALLAALDRRRRTGEGCHLDISQVEATIILMAPQLLDFQVNGQIARARGNRDDQFSPNGVFRAQGEDKWVAITVRSDAEWQVLANVIGGNDLAQDPRFADLAARKLHEDALEGIVGCWTMARPAADVEDILQSVGIPAHRVADTYDVVADPQLAHRESIVRLPHPNGWESVIDAARFSLSETPAQYRRAAPTFGQDNDHVLRDILNYPQERIDALRDAGALA
jgi:crotonobetainyl-CoA:carnitine CoA-transferase CaiB-like acyl-CoA transferase